MPFRYSTRSHLHCCLPEPNTCQNGNSTMTSCEDYNLKFYCNNLLNRLVKIYYHGAFLVPHARVWLRQPLPENLVIRQISLLTSFLEVLMKLLFPELSWSPGVYGAHLWITFRFNDFKLLNLLWVVCFLFKIWYKI